MKILLAPDKFKGSLSALEVCHAIAEGLRQCDQSHEILFHPMADGGDGSIEILNNHLSLTKQILSTRDPLGRSISAHYFTIRKTAFIELASASGLVLLDKEERNPMLTSTLGTGSMILDAIHKGFREIYLFLGGSATNDAGMGIASALGFQFLGNENQQLKPIGQNLSSIKTIRNTRLFDFSTINIMLLCDVQNPLFGPTGAAHVYAAQKGATTKQIEHLDKGLSDFASIINTHTGIEVSSMPGSGAAGGIGASLVALCGAKLVSGFETIATLTGLENVLQSADWVVSGEGKLDVQSLEGKVVHGIAELCNRYEKPFTLFVGKNELNEEHVNVLNAQQILSILDHTNDIEEAMSNGAVFLAKMGFQLCQVLSTLRS